MLASTADSTRVVAAAARWDGRGRDAARSGTEHFFLKADLRIAFYLNVLYRRVRIHSTLTVRVRGTVQ